MSSTNAASATAPQPLHVIYAEHDLALVEEGQGTNKPVVRKRAILDALKRAAASSPSHTTAITFQPLKEPASDLKAALRVHDPTLVELFATGWKRWEELGPNRDLYFSTGGRIDPEHWEELVPSQVAPRDPYQRPGKSVHGAVNFFAQDQMTPITRHTSSILHHDMAVVLEAINQIESGKSKQVYACTTEPGHHSGRQSYGGYCFVNMAAMTATILSDKYKKVALLDVDYHAGNGSMSILYNNPHIFFASLHADPEIEYPYCCGWADQTGEGAGAGTTINVPLPKNTTWKEYQVELRRVLDAMKAFGAEVLVVSLGVDTVADDPECAPLAGFKLFRPDYNEMGAMIRGLGVPTVWIQEGGYKLSEAGEVVRHVLVGPCEGDKQ